MRMILKTDVPFRGPIRVLRGLPSHSIAGDGNILGVVLIERGTASIFLIQVVCPGKTLGAGSIEIHKVKNWLQLWICKSLRIPRLCECSSGLLRSETQ